MSVQNISDQLKSLQVAIEDVNGRVKPLAQQAKRTLQAKPSLTFANCGKTVESVVREADAMETRAGVRHIIGSMAYLLDYAKETSQAATAAALFVCLGVSLNKSSLNPRVEQAGGWSKVIDDALKPDTKHKWTWFVLAVLLLVVGRISRVVF